jgi:uncharacterized repeat protein (TIGR03806 family)
MLVATPVSKSTNTFGYPGATPSISANGTANAIVWVLQNDGSPAILHAYNAANLAQELYNSSQAGSRDQPGGAVLFSLPTIANGKVYVGSQYSITVYGNASAWVATPIITPAGGPFSGSAAVSISEATAGAAIYYTLDNSTPSTNSILYTNTLSISAAVTIKARAFKAGAVASETAQASFYPTQPQTGLGFNANGIGWTLNNGSGPAPVMTSNSLQLTYNSSGNTANSAFYNTRQLIDNFNVSFIYQDATPGGGGADGITFCIQNDPRAATAVGGAGGGLAVPGITPSLEFEINIYSPNNPGIAVQTNGGVGPFLSAGSVNVAGGNPIDVCLNYSLSTGNLQVTLSDLSTAASFTNLYSVGNLANLLGSHTAFIGFTGADGGVNSDQIISNFGFAVPPAVSLTMPTNSATFTAAATLTFSANATAQYTAVTNVAFYANNLFLGNLTTSPYTLTATGIGAGSYALKAVAQEATGLSGTSGPVNITVNAGSGQPYGLASRAPVSAFLNMPGTNTGSLPALLSQTGAFSDTPNLNPATGLIPYTVNVPLWSDGAVKTRWLAVPNSGAPYMPPQQISFAPTGEWNFPNGTVFVKHFEVVTDETHPNIKRRLETRLLVRDNLGAVYGVTYKWRVDNSDADLLPSSLSENILITNASGIRTQVWYYPSRTDCLTCHTPAANYVLGVKTRQLNGPFTYSSSGVTDNQLRTLNRIGLFYPAFDEAAISSFAQLSSLTNLSASLEERARSYLDANCAQCHRPGGPGTTFDARYDTPLTNQNIINAAVINGDLGYDNAKVVVPKDVWRSILYGRMNTTDPAIKMPQLARNLIDTNAVQVMADWINSLPGTPALAPPVIIPTGGSFLSSVVVALQHPDTNATLRYTLDTTLPTTNSVLYAGPFTLTNTATIKAKAFEVAFNDSVAASALFLIRPPIFFTSALGFTNRFFQMQLSGLSGKSYVLQGTTDLTNWVSLSTNLAPSKLFNVLDPAASNFPARLYRAIELP